MRVCVIDHQGLGVPYAAALVERGATLADNPWAFDYDVLLLDYPAGWGGERLVLAKKAAARGIGVVGIPHGGPPLIQFDGCVAPWPGLAVELVPAEGHKRFYEMIGYPAPVGVVGWALSPVLEFSPRRVECLLFAPAHPFSGDGGNSFLPDWQRANANAYRWFLEVECDRRVVRMYGSLEANGLWADNRVDTWETADLQLASAVDSAGRADAVIADGTFLYLASALGKPAVAIHQPPVTSDFGDKTVKNWDRYQGWVRYPYCLDDLTLRDALEAAQVEPAAWRADMIGDPTDADRLFEVVSSAARKPNRASRRARRRSAAKKG